MFIEPLFFLNTCFVKRNYPSCLIIAHGCYKEDRFTRITYGRMHMTYFVILRKESLVMNGSCGIGSICLYRKWTARCSEYPCFFTLFFSLFPYYSILVQPTINLHSSSGIPSCSGTTHGKAPMFLTDSFKPSVSDHNTSTSPFIPRESWYHNARNNCPSKTCSLSHEWLEGYPHYSGITLYFFTRVLFDMVFIPAHQLLPNILAVLQSA